MGAKFTRRRFLTAVGAGWIALTSAPGCKSAERSTKTTAASPAQSRGAGIYHTRPDLRPPAVRVTTKAHDTAPGYVFVAPNKEGVMIFDNRGQVVWFHPLQNAMDFKVQSYQGSPVLTWWGEQAVGGEPGYLIFDNSYREIAKVRAGNGYVADHHEILITPEDTALITIYNVTPQDLSPVGGPKDGLARQGIIQEVDIESGEVLFEWHSLDHVGLDESYLNAPETSEKAYDYLHLNSIDVDHDGNLIISARMTFAVYKIDRKSGEIIRRLGGKNSDFKMGPGTRFSYQHDARRQPDGTITIFDNNTTVFENGVPKTVEESRGIVLELDEDKMSASLVRQYTHPDKQFADASGNMQVLPNGNVFIGWGRALVSSEFGKDGELLFSASLPPNKGTYRAFRFPWSGYPSDRPAVVAKRVSKDEVRVYASWNGATEVATWEVLAGQNPGKLEPVGSVPRDGFETAMLVRTAKPYVAVRAKSSSGRVLSISKPVESRG